MQMSRPYHFDATKASTYLRYVVYSALGGAVIGGVLFVLAMFTMFALVACPYASCL